MHVKASNSSWLYDLAFLRRALSGSLGQARICSRFEASLRVLGLHVEIRVSSGLNDRRIGSRAAGGAIAPPNIS